MKTQLNKLLVLPALIAALGLVLVPSAQAQFQFSQRIASAASLPGGELNVGLALDTNANCYVTGWFDGTNNFGGGTLTNQSTGGGSDIFVAKYNASGALQWAQQAGQSAGNVNYGRAVGADTNGNIYVTGGYQGPATFGNTNLPATPGEQFFLAKYTAISGTNQWVKPSTGGNGNNYGIGLTMDGAGNCYALAVMDYVGVVGTSISFGSSSGSITVTNAKRGTTFLVLVKYDNTGTAQWAQLFDSDQETYGSKLAVDAAGNVYVRGLFEQNMTIGASNLVAAAGSTKNVFIAKFTGSGALTWIQQPQGGNAGEGGVAVDPAGNVFVSGAFTTNLNFGGGIILTNMANSSAPLGDAFLAKYNSAGVIQWAQSAGGTNGGFYWDMALDAQTNIYVAGGLVSGASVSKYSPAGTLQWAYAANGPPPNPIGSVVAKCAVDAVGHCYLDGIYQGTTAFGTNALQPQETYNCFLAETVTNPTVQFTASPSQGLPALTVQFNSTNVDNQGNTLTSWQWNFGDGTTTNTQNPSHTYTNTGTFNPTFIATNSRNVAVLGYGPQIAVLAPTPSTNFNFTTYNGTITITGYIGTNTVVVIPSTINSLPVTMIGNGSFESSGVTGVTIGGDVTNIGTKVFFQCFSLSSITVDPNNPAYSSVSGVLFNKSQTTLVEYPEGNGGTSYTIPNSVTNLGDDAFADCFSLTNVTIGTNVASIGFWAFSQCTGLTSVTFPDSLTSIGEYAFNGCWRLRGSVTIPMRVTNIGTGAFDAYGITAIIVNSSNPAYTNVAGVLFNKSQTTLVEYPEGNGEISYTIPNSVTNIGDDAFGDCFSLTNVTIGTNVANIGFWAFAGSSLTSVTIPDSVINIGDYALFSCTSLTDVTIPTSVRSIGEYTFSDCFSLTNAYFQGNAPTVDGQLGSADSTVFSGESGTAYYLPGTTGWGATFGGWPTAGWYQPNPTILGSGYGLGVQSNQFGFTVSWATNLSVVVQASTNLSNPVWTSLATNPLVGGTNYFSDPNWTNYPRRFYRITTP